MISMVLFSYDRFGATCDLQDVSKAGIISKIDMVWL
jgi:hypothetical protein